MNFKKLILPVSICILLSSFNVLNTNLSRLTIDTSRIISSCATTSIYLLTIWVVNSVLYTKQYFVYFTNNAFLKVVSALVFNTLLISGIIFFAENILDDTTNVLGQRPPSWVLFIKLSIATALIVCIQYAIASLQQAQTYKLAIAQLQNENLEARLQSLKQQINPHFLFNALSTLRTMVRVNDANSEKFIINLSEVYRQLLNKRDSATITLEEEIGFLKSYVFMLQARFEDTLNVDVAVMQESMKKQIPAFSMQLLVENCIKHNIISSAKPLYIKIYQENELLITVENNLQLKASVAPEFSGTGLLNLQKRYELLNVEKGLIVSSTNELFKVTLKLL